MFDKQQAKSRAIEIAREWSAEYPDDGQVSVWIFPQAKRFDDYATVDFGEPPREIGLVKVATFRAGKQVFPLPMIPHTVAAGTRLVGQSKCIWCGRRVRSNEPCLTEDEKNDLAIFAFAAGRKWKTILGNMRAAGQLDQSLTHVFNKLGPTGLARLKPSLIKRRLESVGAEILQEASSRCNQK